MRVDEISRRWYKHNFHPIYDPTRTQRSQLMTVLRSPLSGLARYPTKSFLSIQ